MIKISVSGKGGVGKSVVVTLLTNVLSEAGYTVLTVDSDESNPGLYMMLGFNRAPKPLIDMFGGERRVAKSISKVDVPSDDSGVLLKSLVEQEIRLKDISDEYLLERGNVKLVTVGKMTDALQGCACPLGQVSRIFLEKLALTDNEIALVDMEAGVEHFGRGVEKGIDAVLAVVEPSFESLALAAKVNFMARGTGVKHVWAILNKIPSSSIEEQLKGELTKRGVKTLGAIRYDPRVSEDCLLGKPLGESEAKEDARKIAQLLLQQPE